MSDVTLQIAYLEKRVASSALGPILDAAIREMRLTDSDFGLLVSPLQIRFAKLSEVRKPALPEGLERGFFFGSGGQIEVREVAPGEYGAVAFREGAPVSLHGWNAESLQVLKLKEDPDSLVLWGSKSQNAPVWHEGRVRRVQEYPWPSADRAPTHVALKVCIYRDPTNLQPAYVWWKGLAAAKEEAQ